MTHPELDHKYDDAHDVTPVDFKEHAILHALPHPDSHSYEGTLDPYPITHSIEPYHEAYAADHSTVSVAEVETPMK